MKKISNVGYRFPPEIIHRTIWLYLRFTLSVCNVKDLLSERGIMILYKTIRRWVIHFGPLIAAALALHPLNDAYRRSGHLPNNHPPRDGRLDGCSEPQKQTEAVQC
ncbi:MAG: hypothetical protein WCG38_20715, partial [Aestuariivirga sp.]